MWVGKREQIDGFRLVLAVDRQVKDMLRKFWIVPGLFDLLFICKGSLKLFVLGLGTGRSFDAVVHKPVTVASHGDQLHSFYQLDYRPADAPQPMFGVVGLQSSTAVSESCRREGSARFHLQRFKPRVGLKIHMQGHNSRAGHKMPPAKLTWTLVSGPNFSPAVVPING